MKKINTVGILSALIMGVVAVYFTEEVKTERWGGFMNDFMNYSDSSVIYENKADELSMQAAGIMLLLTGYFIFGFIRNLMKIKTMTTRVISIVGLSFTLIAFLFGLVSILDPAGASFDETGPVFIGYGILCLAFFVVLFIQASRQEIQRDPTVLDDLNLDG